jgi:hypothetical protein
VALQHVIEQCCHYFFQHDRFPATYEELQPLPLLRSGPLSYAGDDGGELGQVYRLALDLQASHREPFTSTSPLRRRSCWR